jgi:hypothetical protein
VEIRDLRHGETAFLQEMLSTALNRRPDVELPPREWVLEHPQVVPFHTAWGREGDTVSWPRRTARSSSSTLA